MQLPGLIAGWYTCSIALSLYNKWMFDPHKGLRVPYPILITSIHQFLLWGMSYTYLRTRSQLSKEPAKGWAHYFRYVIPTALSSAGDVGFGNVSFKFITLTMYTIVKSSSIAFVLLFGCICKLERFRLKLVLIVLVMFCGVVLMVYKPDRSLQEHSADNELLGFFLVLASSCLSGLRWVYTQILLQQSSDANYIRNGKKTNPMHTIYRLSPLMGTVLFVTALAIEKPFPVIASTSIMTWDGHSTTMALLRGSGMLILPGIAVFIMTICEFGILQTAPVLTLSIAGIVKELFTIFTGIIVLRETLGFYNWIGMAIVLLDVCFYNYYRYSEASSLARPYTPLDTDPEASRELDDLSVK